MEAEQKLELQAESSTNIRNNLNKAKSDWKYKPVKSINLTYYLDMIYIPKTIRKRFLKWYHFYLQNPSGDRLYQRLTTVCRWPGIVYQAWKLCRTCKDCQEFKIRNTKYGLIPAKYAETLTP